MTSPDEIALNFLLLCPLSLFLSLQIPSVNPKEEGRKERFPFVPGRRNENTHTSSCSQCNQAPFLLFSASSVCCVHLRSIPLDPHTLVEKGAPGPCLVLKKRMGRVKHRGVTQRERGKSGSILFFFFEKKSKLTCIFVGRILLLFSFFRVMDNEVCVRVCRVRLTARGPRERRRDTTVHRSCVES